MDPPWQNKSVKRGCKYKIHSNEDLFNWCCLDKITHDETLIAIWITNKKSIEDFVRDYFNAMEFEYAGEWVWVKCKFIFLTFIGVES